MDLLLRKLQASVVGLTVNNFYAAGFLHADDIRMLATYYIIIASEASLYQQFKLVKEFADHIIF